MSACPDSKESLTAFREKRPAIYRSFNAIDDSEFFVMVVPHPFVAGEDDE
jgi:hypothetical protein